MKEQINENLFDTVQSSTGDDNTAEAAVTADSEVGSQTDKAVIAYGKQPASVPSETGKTSGEEEWSYKQFKEKFKQEYQQDLQRVIDKRFKNSKQIEAQRDALMEQNRRFDALLGALNERYGTDDPELLLARIGEDDSFLAQKAEEEGMGLDEYKRVYAAERKAHSLEQELQHVNLQIKQQALVDKWQRQADELTQIYPEFSLADEIDNEKFSLALQYGMDMRDAYQYAHFDEILGGAIKYAVDNVEKKLTHDSAVRAARPPENGISGSAGAIIKSDVGKLTTADMEEIDKLVLRGEKISF